jgi:hypothetical protein
VNDRIDLGDFSAALRGELEDEMFEDPPVQDLADVFARARAIDEAAIPPGLHAIELAEADAEDIVDSGLRSFAGALRQEVESSVVERQLVPIATKRRRVAPIAAVVTLAAAAAVLVAVGLSQFGPQVAERDDRGQPVVEADAHDAKDEQLPFVPGTTPEPRRVIEPAPVEAEPEPLPAPSSDKAPRKRHVPTLDELDAAANERWTAGDLAGAEALLRKIIARAGRSARAELAYGDLFAIARQRGGASAQALVWREYLRRFPKGRYADDAQGGLCRLAPSDERASCWNGYLAVHPRGAHAREARRHAENGDG